MIVVSVFSICVSEKDKEKGRESGAPPSAVDYMCFQWPINFGGGLRV